MCDHGPINAFLAAAVGLLLAAVTTIIVAAIANASILGAFASPGLMVLAGLLSLAALVLLNLAKGRAYDYVVCMSEDLNGKQLKCDGQYTNFNRNILAVITVVGIQTAACFSAAVYAWIPGVAQPSMWTIIAALILQVALILSLLAFWAALRDCLNR